MLDNNSNVTGLHTAQINFQVKAIGIKLNPSLLLVQPFECCPWCSALENKRHVLLPSISLVWRARHVQPSLESLFLTTCSRSCSFNLQNPWLTPHALWITLSAGSSCSQFCLSSSMSCLFCISGALLWTMFWFLFLFFFFSPLGLQQHGIWRLHKPWWFKPPNQLVGSASPPCYRRQADRHRQGVSNTKSLSFLPLVRWRQLSFFQQIPASFTLRLLQLVQRMKHNEDCTKGHFKHVTCYDKNKKYPAPQTHQVQPTTQHVSNVHIDTETKETPKNL